MYTKLSKKLKKKCKNIWFKNIVLSLFIEKKIEEGLNIQVSLCIY